MSTLGDELTPEEELNGFTTDETDNETFSSKGTYPSDIPRYNDNSFLNSQVVSSISPDALEIPETEVHRKEDADVSDNLDIPKETASSGIDDFSPFMEDYVIHSQENPDEALSSNKEPIMDTNDTSLEDEFFRGKNIAPVEAKNTNPSKDDAIALDNDFLNMLRMDVANSPQDDNLSQLEDVGDVVKTGNVDTPNLDAADSGVSADLTNMEFNTWGNQTDDTMTNPLNEQGVYDEPLEPQRFASYATMADDVISHNANIDNENVDSVKRDEKSPITENEEQESKTMKPVNKETKKKATIVIIIAILVAVLIGSGVLLWLVMSRPSDTSIPAPKSKAITQDTVRPPLDTIKPNDDVKDSTKIDSNIVDTTNKASTDTPKSILPPATPPVTPKPKVETKSTSPSVPKANQPAPKPKEISTPATAEFAVQVYASPSRSDAETRLATLKDKGLEGVLSTYQKRGEVWYRVRLSQHFKTYEEARGFAASNGLSKVWIDRIK